MIKHVLTGIFLLMFLKSLLNIFLWWCLCFNAVHKILSSLIKKFSNIFFSNYFFILENKSLKNFWLFENWKTFNWKISSQGKLVSKPLSKLCKKWIPTFFPLRKSNSNFCVNLTSNKIVFFTEKILSNLN